MKYKTFRIASAISSGLLGFITAISITHGNYIIPLTAMAVFAALIATLKMYVTEKKVLTDERIDKIAGKAAKITFVIMLYFLAIATVIFAALSKSTPEFFNYTLITSVTCGIMLVTYLIAVAYFNKKM